MHSSLLQLFLPQFQLCIINDTVAVTLIVVDLYVTPFKLTIPNPYTVALGLYMAGWRGSGPCA